MSSSWVFVAQIGSEIVNEDSYFALTTSRLAVVILSVTKAIAGWNLKFPPQQVCFLKHSMTMLMKVESGWAQTLSYSQCSGQS